MSTRNLEGRLIKLEQRGRREDQVRLYWRKPDQTFADVARGHLLMPSDRVACAIWYGDDEPPGPEWISPAARLRGERSEYIGKMLEAILERADAAGSPHRQAPREPYNMMPDSELIYLCLGIDKVTLAKVMQ